jgi:hypothetical protein
MARAAYYHAAPAFARRVGVAGYLDLEVLDPNGGRQVIARNIECKDKREARQIATSKGFKPWNF